jgi:hypothetical protein
MIASAAFAAELEPLRVDEQLLSDGEHRAAENATGEPIASAIIAAHRDGHDALHRPDFALVKRDRGEVVAVEIELTLKTGRGSSASSAAMSEIRTSRRSTITRLGRSGKQFAGRTSRRRRRHP